MARYALASQSTTAVTVQTGVFILAMRTTATTKEFAPVSRHMATYRVQPTSDANSQRYGWKVTKNGRQVGNAHTKKSAAKRKARRKRGQGDSVVLHRKDGTVQGSM